MVPVPWVTPSPDFKAANVFRNNIIMTKTVQDWAMVTIYSLSDSAILNDLEWPQPKIQGYSTCQRQTSQDGHGAIYTVQLQTTHLHFLNLQCNVPLMHGPSAIAEPLVWTKIPVVKGLSAWPLHIPQWQYWNWQLMVPSWIMQSTAAR